MTNTQNLKGIRCPKCYNESAFVVQMTMNVVMNDDGIDFMGVQQPPLDAFPGRVIPEDDGFEDEAPITCFQRPSMLWDTGCGYMGTVGEFRVPEAPSIDDAACREAGRHKASTRHTHEICSVVVEEEAARESEEGSWRDEECFRASGEVVCEHCSLPYWRHRQVARKDAPTLVRACDGRLLKL